MVINSLFISLLLFLRGRKQVQWLLWSQGIAGLLGIFTQRGYSLLPDVAAVGTYLEGVLACLCQPTAVGFVKRGKVSLL